MSQKSLITTLSLQAGFDRVGFSILKEKSEGFFRFQTWIDEGYAGEMSYLARGAEKRAVPNLVLKGAKTLVSLAWDYGQETLEMHASSSPLSDPSIARYAWLQDYHDTLGEKLKRLEKQLNREFPAHQFKSYVDTGPVQEKYWASLSKLGWMGKHTNLINPEHGSYFLLACILTDLPLEADLPETNHCGKCSACIDVCPTRAIVAPYVLDARLCISYLTIEFKGVIPKPLRPLIGTHVFGCDDCQEVCPWNRHARLPDAGLRSARVSDLISYLSLSKAGFKERFRNSPVLRSKRRGFLRNVCVVLGNLRDPLSLPALAQALEDEEELIRGHAAWALGQFKNGKGRKFLEGRKPKEEVGWVKDEIEGALAGADTPPASPNQS